MKTKSKTEITVETHRLLTLMQGGQSPAGAERKDVEKLILLLDGATDTLPGKLPETILGILEGHVASSDDSSVEILLLRIHRFIVPSQTGAVADASIRLCAALTNRRNKNEQ